MNILGKYTISQNLLGSGLVAEATTSPVPLDLLSALVVVGLDGLDQLGERGPVVRVHVGDGDAGGGLAAAHSPEPGQFNFKTRVISCSIFPLMNYPV